MGNLARFRGMHQEVVPPSDTCAEDTAPPSSEAPRRLAKGYEPPRIIVIGNVRDLTMGSASSGRSDANSQYYW